MRHDRHGLGVGADDYVTKPFDMEELAARINAVLHRTVLVVSRIRLGFGDRVGALFGRCILGDVAVEIDRSVHDHPRARNRGERAHLRQIAHAGRPPGAMAPCW